MQVRLAVISCAAYSDAWMPFFQLLKRFWPHCPYPVTLLTDAFKSNLTLPMLGGVHAVGSPSWCEILRTFAEKYPDDISILFQEDMFLNANVIQLKIERAISLMVNSDAGCVRLYPCPGAESDIGDPEFAEIDAEARYRISCQCAAWRGSYLAAIARQCGSTPADFEIHGTQLSNALPQPVLGWKRDVTPWPMQYLCSAISRGKWNRDAKRLCEEHGIEVDWSRGFAA